MRGVVGRTLGITQSVAARGLTLTCVRGENAATAVLA